MVKRFLIALDLDGTLLNASKKISPKTRKYIQSLAKHHYVVLATGRPYRAVKAIYEQLELQTPVVCYNGAFVKHPFDNQFKEQSFAFPQTIVKDIIQQVDTEYLANFMCETNDTIWLKQEEHELESFFWHTNMDIKIGPIQQTLNQDPMTLILQSYRRDEKSDEALRNVVNQYKDLSIRFWGDSPYSEIYFHHISKAFGLKLILNYYHLTPSDLIVFGDAENDVEMLKLTSYSFAMKNGVDIVKKVAKHITEFDHNHDGIVVELKRFLKAEQDRID